MHADATCARALLTAVGLVGQLLATPAEGGANGSAPGFADLRLGVADGMIDGNFILRQPLFVGGASCDALDGAPDTVAIGGFARHTVDADGLGELVLGGNYVSSGESRQWEAQAGYVAPGGIGLGAGVARLEESGNTWFVNATARGRLGAVGFHVGPLVQNNPGGTSFGGYAALYSDHVFLGGGSDGEQWRLLGAWSAASGDDAALDPSIEVLLVDHGIGRLDGERFLFVNGSLKRNAGFLSTASRLGRALGPQGMQFANPVSFLSQPWSRTVDVWETGGIVNLRLARRETRGGRTSSLAQGVLFPMQVLPGQARLRGLFAGIEHERDLSRSTSVLLGYAGRPGRASIHVAGAYDFSQDTVSGSLGIRVFF